MAKVTDKLHHLPAEVSSLLYELAVAYRWMNS